MQKSYVDWLKLGDKNTKFFHTTMLVRRRKNKVEALKDGDGAWVMHSAKLKDMDIQYYRDLFTSDIKSGGEFIRGSFPELDTGTRESRWIR